MKVDYPLTKRLLAVLNSILPGHHYPLVNMILDLNRKCNSDMLLLNKSILHFAHEINIYTQFRETMKKEFGNTITIIEQ